MTLEANTVIEVDDRGDGIVCRDYRFPAR